MSVQYPKWIPILFLSEIRQIIPAKNQEKPSYTLLVMTNFSWLSTDRVLKCSSSFFLNTPLSKLYARVLKHTSNLKYIQNGTCSGFTTRSWNRHLLIAPESHQPQRKSIYQLVQNYLLSLILSVNLHPDGFIFSFKVYQESVPES